MQYRDDDEDDAQSVTLQPDVVEVQSEPWSYQSSIFSLRSKQDSSIRSLFPPQSWPSSAVLAHDSDVYPAKWASRERTPKREDSSLLSEIEVELGITKLKKEGHLSFTEDRIQEKCSSIRSSFDEQKERKCYAVCDSVSACSSENSSKSIGSMPGFVTPSDPPIWNIPEFDIAGIETYIELPMKKRIVDKMCFTETLIISHDKGGLLDEPGEARKLHSELLDPQRVKEIGEMCISIEQSERNVITYCTSQFSFNDCAATSSILSIVDRKFSLSEERKVEALHKPYGKEEKSLHVFRDHGDYIALRTITDETETKRLRGTFTMNVGGSLIMDGGGLALLRYLILIKFTGELEVWSMHISGEICCAVFKVGKHKLLMINNRPHKTIRVLKLLFRANRKPEVSKTYFLPSGHLVRHRWMGCPYLIHLNPFGIIPPCRYFSSLETTWEKDIQLFSKYLDIKQEKQSEIRTYLEDQGEVKCMIKDYLLCLLQNKPNQVLEFTLDYFQNLLTEG